MNAASQEARVLSSGTIASLIHRSDYKAIDYAQEQFVAFIERMDAMNNGLPVYHHWQDAWKAFRQTDKVYEVMLSV